jgi:hypothetical protein
VNISQLVQSFSDDHISVKNCERLAPEILECITDSSGSTEKLSFLDDHKF